MELIKSTNYVIPCFGTNKVVKSDRKYQHVMNTIYETKHDLTECQEEFNKEFKINTYGIFEEFIFDKTKYVIAGGFLLKTIRKDLEIGDSDIDIFFIGNNIERNLNEMIKYLEQFGELEFKEYGAVKDVRYIKCNNPDFAKLKIQFIGTSNTNADEIISGFDLTYIQMYYAGGILYTTVEATDTLITGYCKSSLFFNTNTYGNIIPFGNRMDKVIRRGYSFAFNNKDCLREYKTYRIIMNKFGGNYAIVKLIASYKSRIFTYWSGSNYGKFKNFKRKYKYKKPTWGKLFTITKSFKFGIKRQRCNRRLKYVTDIEKVNVENIRIPRNDIIGDTKPVGSYCSFIYRGKTKLGKIYEFITSCLYSPMPLYCSYFQNSNNEKKFKDHGDGCSYNNVIIPKNHLLHLLLEKMELRCRTDNINVCYNNCNYISKAMQVLEFNSNSPTYKSFNVKIKLRTKPKNIEKINGFRLLGWRLLLDTVTFSDITTVNVRIDVMYPGFSEYMVLRS